MTEASTRAIYPEQADYCARPEKCKPGEKWIYPGNCHKFYRCYAKSGWVEKVCPGSKVFTYSVHLCRASTDGCRGQECPDFVLNNATTQSIVSTQTESIVGTTHLSSTQAQTTAYTDIPTADIPEHTVAVTHTNDGSTIEGSTPYQSTVKDEDSTVINPQTTLVEQTTLPDSAPHTTTQIDSITSEPTTQEQKTSPEESTSPRHTTREVETAISTEEVNTTDKVFGTTDASTKLPNVETTETSQEATKSATTIKHYTTYKGRYFKIKLYYYIFRTV